VTPLALVAAALLTAVPPTAPPAVRVLDPQVRVLDPQVRSLRTETTDGATTTITLNTDVLFDFDSATLTPAAAGVVDDTAGRLRSGTGAVTVVGHTDGVGTDAYNLDLSRRRAEAVGARLRAAGRPVTTEGRGESEPVAPETVNGQDDPAGRARNRRVEITTPG
jgi:OmpA-OmpF porin, OOP family